MARLLVSVNDKCYLHLTNVQFINNCREKQSENMNGPEAVERQWKDGFVTLKHVRLLPLDLQQNSTRGATNPEV